MESERFFRAKSSSSRYLTLKPMMSILPSVDHSSTNNNKKRKCKMKWWRIKLGVGSPAAPPYWVGVAMFNFGTKTCYNDKQIKIIHFTTANWALIHHSNTPFGISGLPRSDSRYAASWGTSSYIWQPEDTILKGATKVINIYRLLVVNG